MRYADDAVMAFENFRDAKRVLGVLGKRLHRYGLTLHPEKTRFVDFRLQRPGGSPSGDGGDLVHFLGFCHVWGRTAEGQATSVRQVTAKNRYRPRAGGGHRLVSDATGIGRSASSTPIWRG